MADRYWVGGTGTWNGTSTTNWSASSGGATGASVPTAADNVFFDVNSNTGTGAFTVTMATSPRVCNDFTASGLDGTMTLAGASIGLTVSGSLTFQATNFTRTYTGITTFNATTTGKTVTTNGVAFGGGVVFNGVGGGWTLGSALSTGINNFTVTNGTFDTSSAGNYSLTSSEITSSNTNVRTINLNASTVSTLSGTTFTTSTNLTFNAGTSQINVTSNNITFAGGGQTFHNVSFTSAQPSPLITGANTFNNLTITGRTSTGISDYEFAANQVINGTLKLGAGTTASCRLFLTSNVIGTPRTLTCAAISSVTDVDFRDINFAGAISLPVTGTRLGDCKGNSNITFDAAKTVYYRQTGSANWGVTGSGSWSATSGGALDATMFPLAQDTAVFPAATYPASGSTTTINASYNIGTIDMSLRTSNTMTLATGSTNLNIYGNWINGTGITISGTGAMTFAGRTTQQITSAGVAFTQPVAVNSPSGTLQLLDAATSTGSGGFSHLIGTLDLNGYSFSMFSYGMNGTSGPANIDASTTGSSIFLTGASGNWTANGTGTLTGILPVYLSSTSATANNRDIRNTAFPPTTTSRPDFYITGGSGLATVTFGVSGGSQGTIDFTGFSGTCNLGTLTGGSLSCLISCRGNFILSSGMSTGTAGTSGNLNLYGFQGGGTCNITTNGKTITRAPNFGQSVNPSATFVLQDDFYCDPTVVGPTLNYGTLDLNGKTMTVGTRFTTASGTKNLTFNGGTLVCPAATTTAFNNAAPTGFTTTAGTGVGTISMTAATAKTFVGGGSTFNCTLNQGGSGTLTVSGSNRFLNITNTVQPATVLFTAGTTNIFTSFSLSGTAGNLITLGSTTTSQATLQKGSTWYMGANSTDAGNNTGLTFTAGGGIDYLNVSYINGTVVGPSGYVAGGQFFAFF
jgi:hypothetical protein